MKRVSTNMGGMAVALTPVVASVHAQNRGRDKNASDLTVSMAAVGHGRGTPEVRHALVMLHSYGVFDNLGYRVDAGTVSLSGRVTRPTIKISAENAGRCNSCRPYGMSLTTKRACSV